MVLKDGLQNYILWFGLYLHYIRHDKLNTLYGVYCNHKRIKWLNQCWPDSLMSQRISSPLCIISCKICCPDARDLSDHYLKQRKKVHYTFLIAMYVHYLNRSLCYVSALHASAWLPRTQLAQGAARLLPGGPWGTTRCGIHHLPSENIFIFKTSVCYC